MSDAPIRAEYEALLRRMTALERTQAELREDHDVLEVSCGRMSTSPGVPGRFTPAAYVAFEQLTEDQKKQAQDMLRAQQRVIVRLRDLEPFTISLKGASRWSENPNAPTAVTHEESSDELLDIVAQGFEALAPLFVWGERLGQMKPASDRLKLRVATIRSLLASEAAIQARLAAAEQRAVDLEIQNERRRQEIDEEATVKSTAIADQLAVEERHLAVVHGQVVEQQARYDALKADTAALLAKHGIPTPA